VLVLSRKRGESIIVADHIVVTVLEVRGSRVRLGIKGPKDVPVHRQEVFDAIKNGRTRGPEAAIC
jgi:carbon storage regulator